jgi:hypothetical protein
MKRLSALSVAVINPPWRGTLRSDSFECHVLAVIGNTLALEPLDRAATLWLPERLEDALLTFRDDGLLVGLSGTLWQREGVVGDLRFSVTDTIQDNAHSATRVTLCAPITVRGADAETAVESLTVDVGAFGMLIESALEPTPGERVSFSLALPGTDEPVVGDAIVTSVPEDGKIELTISRRERDLRSRLARFVVAHNRGLLRRRPPPELELDF